MKKTRILFIALAMLISLCVGISAYATSTNTKSDVVTDHDQKHLSNLGITLDDNEISTETKSNNLKVKKSDTEAKDIAAKAYPKWASDGKDVKVEYHYITNKSFNGFSKEAIDKNPNLKVTGHMEKTPVYIVTFKGMSYASHVPDNYQGEVPVHHEYNVVVDAITGEPLMGFSYR